MRKAAHPPSITNGYELPDGPLVREAYGPLPVPTRESARKAYRLWRDNPFHPSLHFKCINQKERIWSLRITRGYRALCIFDGGDVTWFWIGTHVDYDRFFG